MQTFKTKITLLLLFIGFVAQAGFKPATILFKDGHTETGFVKSFMENKWLPFVGNFMGIEKKLNYDDKTLKFKTDKEGKARTLTIDEIDEVRIENGNSYYAYKALPLKVINKKGEFVDRKLKIWLPLIKKGKISIYGFSYTRQRTDHRGMSTGMPTTSYRFYLHKEGEDFAIDPYKKISIFGGKGNHTILKSLFNHLFKDCETVYNKQLPETIKFISHDQTDEEREKSKNEYKQKLKDYKLSNMNLLNQFYISHYTTADLINASEKECG